MSELVISTHVSETNIVPENGNNKSPVLSDDNEEIFTVTKKRIQTFSDSGSDMDNHFMVTSENVHSPNNITKVSDNDSTSPLKNKKKSRIKKIQNTDSENESSSENPKTHYESVRTLNKKRNLKEKFKCLSAKSKDEETSHIPISDSKGPDNSDDEYCLQIKEILKTSMSTMKSICDPDTSEDESEKQQINQKKKQKPKKVKLTSPKPQRMSAKQAMENMQKIKSESNRMLREKEVSLPYHRPKALSLKDIMSRRKPVVSSDGKTLPIKMNEEQLKQYALMLEQRQKEVIELCKSDTEEDEAQESDERINESIVPDTKETELSKENITDQTIVESLKDTDNIKNDETNSEYNKNVVNVYSENIQADEGTRLEIDNEENSTNNSVSIDFESEKDVEQHNEMNSEIDEQVTPINENEFDYKEHSNKVEDDSQIMALHYDSEKAISTQDSKIPSIELDECNKSKEQEMQDEDVSFLNDINFDELDKDFFKNSEDNYESLAINDIVKANPIPKLTGGPGSFIDLNGSDSSVPRKLSGVEVLKERFTFYANLKTLEDMEKDREKKYKPGTQHLKLKQELEQQISEQRSLEWEKRLEEEKQLKSDLDHISDDDIEKIEAKLENEDKIDDESSESEEEPIENDVLLVDKPRKPNPMVDDEAEVSDGDVLDDKDDKESNEIGEENDDQSEAEVGDLDSDESSSESEVEDFKPRKGRILKAFEDSDEESGVEKSETLVNNDNNCPLTNLVPIIEHEDNIKETQDENLQLAQANRSSDDLFSTQESNNQEALLYKNTDDNISSDLGSQTFSIMNSVNANNMVDLDSSDKMPIVCETQTQSDLNLDHIVPMCSGSFSQNLVTTQDQPPTQSQEIRDDIVVLCTGKFYDNPFVPQNKNPDVSLTCETQSQFDQNVMELCTGKFYDNPLVTQDFEKDSNTSTKIDENSEISKEIVGKESTILKSILEELDGPDLEVKQNKYFLNSQHNKDNIENTQKKKFVIDSDEENDNTTSVKRIKKLRKRKAEQRALQFSDDEEDVENDSDDYESDKEERIIEYDSEENEVEVLPKQPAKKKRIGEFFENEAELTSEDEWAGSGDEDERGLDRMEREEGDDDTFHQGRLQRELGQIHMREVLDQDKREVRLLQELLFEDGDLGDGHRQRKFRWKNADGELETGTNPDEFADTQDDEFESEEQWRKQRHEREMFLRKMQEEKQDNLDTSITRNTLIKANLNGRSMSMITSEPKSSKGESIDAIPEKKTTTDLPSPKKSFTIFQQNYHGSLLTRGRGSLARLAALATPLVTDDDAPALTASTSRGNFVFAALSDQPKVTKRKAEQVNTPRLIKKMKTEQTSKYLKNSLLDHLKA